MNGPIRSRMWFHWNFDPIVYPLKKRRRRRYFCPLDLIINFCLLDLIMVVILVSIIEFEETWTQDLDIEQKNAVMNQLCICSVTFLYSCNNITTTLIQISFITHAFNCLFLVSCLSTSIFVPIRSSYLSLLDDR